MNNVINLIDFLCGCRFRTISFIVNNYFFSGRSWDIKAIKLTKMILVFVIFLFYHSQLYNLTKINISIVKIEILNTKLI
jgi:hypothetical protein